MKMTNNWVQTWGQSHSALALFYYPSARKTYRLVVNSAITGEKLRLTLSNRYGRNDVVIGAVTAAPCDENGAATGGFIPLTFDGKNSFTLPKAMRMRSDEIDFSVKTGSFFCLNIFVKKGDLNSGNLLDNVKLLTVDGNYSETAAFADRKRQRDGVIKVMGKLLGMHFPRPIPLFDSVELLNTDGAQSVVVFGDSISQQGFWTNPFERRLRERFPGRYSLINKSVMGNRLLYDCNPIFIMRGLYGKRATVRILDDIYPYDNISHVILSLGVNDVFEYATVNATPDEKPDPLKVCEAIEKITYDLHKRGIRVIAFNVPAFGTAPDATHEKDRLRRVINGWFAEHQDLFDGFFDVAAAAADPEDDYCSKAEFIGPDKLHPNAYGGEFLAGLVDLEMFN